MKNRVRRKGLILGIIVLLVGAGIIPSIVGTIENNNSKSNIIFGGYIQGLIDNASNGDTIYIPSGTYYENIVINKSISLIGEDRNTTIIDGGENGTVVYITADRVNISGFTIQKSGEWWWDAGIDIHATNNTITENNIFFNNRDGIRIAGDGNVIKYNHIKLNNESGICLWWASGHNTILDNIIELNNQTGISIYGIINAPHTPWEFSKANIVQGNDISHNKNGIYLDMACFNFILKNNFIDNEQDAFFENSILNRWNQNYWNEPRILPKIILGQIEIGQGQYNQWIDIDWRPALRPYDIP